MAFAVQLQETLDRRQSRLESEFAAGADLRTILNGHLEAIESTAQTELITSILLLDETRTRLRHAAGPRLPQSYCEAIDGSEIGPSAGSCGTAAFLGRPIYVSDIENDALWADYRDLALIHGFRACWSTPIFDPGGAVLGTFAIYHLTPRSPTADEVKSISLITDLVGQAILFARSREQKAHAEEADSRAVRVIELHPERFPIDPHVIGDLADLEQRLINCTARLSRLAETVEAREITHHLTAVATDCEALVSFLRRHRQQLN